MILKTSVLFLVFAAVINCHRAGESRKRLPYNSTVVNCVRFKRASNQHECVLTPEEMEGPYFVAEELVRSDITEGHPGMPLTLNISITDASNCMPIGNAKVFVWHTDYLGYYSGFTEYDPNKPAPDVDKANTTDDTRFMRGMQITDHNGYVAFETVFPGWYYGRTIHIHIETYVGGNVAHVTQVYFDEKLTETIVSQAPYNKRNFPRKKNSEDHIFVDENGKDLVLDVMRTETGLLQTTINLGVDPSKISN